MGKSNLIDVLMLFIICITFLAAVHKICGTVERVNRPPLELDVTSFCETAKWYQQRWVGQ